MGGRGATPEQQFLLKLLSRPSAIFALRPLACFCCDKTFHRQYQYSQGQDKHAPSLGFASCLGQNGYRSACRVRLRSRVSFLRPWRRARAACVTETHSKSKNAHARDKSF